MSWYISGRHFEVQEEYWNEGALSRTESKGYLTAVRSSPKCNATILPRAGITWMDLPAFQFQEGEEDDYSKNLCLNASFFPHCLGILFRINRRAL